MDNEKLLFYDLEVFKYDSLAVFKDMRTKEITHFWSKETGEFKEDSPNGFEGIREFIDGRILAGYSCLFESSKNRAASRTVLCDWRRAGGRLPLRRHYKRG